MERRRFLKNMGAGSIYMALSSCASSGISRNKYNEEVTREAWNSLQKPKNPAFDYVNPDKKLPNVLLYGDSISIGYTPTVRKELAGKANVFRIYQNGMASLDLIPKMETMRKTMFQPYLKQGWDFDWDVIHFNVGLHDSKYMKEGKLDKANGKVVSSLEQYRTRLRQVCEYLTKTYPKAKLIFATTTAVPEGAEGRFAGDSIKYNKIALEVLAAYSSIEINDLYSFTIANAASWYIKPGNVHYNDVGKTAQGKEVANLIVKYL